MSAKRTALWRGSSGIVESPESPEWDLTGSVNTCVRTFEGPYETLLKNPPTFGAVMSGLPAGYTVDRIKIKRHRSTKATMVVTLTKDTSGTGTGADEGDSQYEKDWAEIQQPIESHPIYASGTYALSEGGRVDVEHWRDEADASLRKLYKYKDEDGSIIELSTEAKHLAKKILKGITSYPVYIPVLRKTTVTRADASASTAGKRESPPSGFGVVPKQADGSDWVWVKTADRSVRSGKHGKWQRMEEWSGFDSVDADLYPA